MTIKQARNLKPGDKIQKLHGNIMEVVSIEDSRNSFTTNDYVRIVCKTDSGNIMTYNHKGLILVENG